MTRATPGTAAAAGSLRVRVGGNDVVLTPDRSALVGRGSDADLRCDDPRLSRRHLTLSHRDGTWTVEDAGSANGTFAGGRRVDRLQVTAPVRLLLGGAADGVPLDLYPLVETAPAAPTRLQPEAAPTMAYGTAGAAGKALQESLDLGRLAQVHSPGGRAVLGRGRECDIVVPDLLVSRRHAELTRDAAGTLTVTDLGSHNGTFVNGRRVDGSPLRQGDLLTVGSHTFRLETGGLAQYVPSGGVSFDVAGLTVRAPQGRTLLADVSFALPPCSLVAVVGPSGAGKSTLLNALTGFRPADQGRVLYGGRDLYAAYDDLRRRLGFVPQDDIIHTTLTVRQALSYAAELRFAPDVQPQERAQRVQEVMGELGLSERADLPIEKLSGGQRKRVSIAVELLTRPSLLFLDEPTSGLDPGYEKSVMQLLRQLADGGRTVVVVTHSMQSIALCDRILYLAPGGRTAFFGPPQEALEYFSRTDPADIFSDLEQRKDVDWPARFAATEACERYVRAPLASVRADAAPTGAVVQPVPTRTWKAQFGTLARRYLAVIASDRRNLLLLLLQAPFIAVLMLAALPANGLSTFIDSGQTARRLATQPVTDVTLLTLGMTMVGVLNAIREIVKESTIYRRERSVGLSIPAYLGSKLAVLGPLTLLQALVISVVGTLRQGSDVSAALFGSETFELFIDLSLTGLAALTLGLFVSSVVRSADKAVTVLVMVLVGELVLSTPAIPIGNTPVLHQLSWLSSAKWGYDAVGSTVDMRRFYIPSAAQLQAAGAAGGADAAGLPVDPSQLTVDQLAQVCPQLSSVDQSQLQADQITAFNMVQSFCLHGDWEHSPRTWTLDALMLLLLTLGGAGGCLLLLWRRDPALLRAGNRRAARPAAAPAPVVAA